MRGPQGLTVRPKTSKRPLRLIQAEGLSGSSSSSGIYLPPTQPTSATSMACVSKNTSNFEKQPPGLGPQPLLQRLEAADRRRIELSVAKRKEIPMSAWHATNRGELKR